VALKKKKRRSNRAYQKENDKKINKKESETPQTQQIEEKKHS
jgi:hypothetical protein